MSRGPARVGELGGGMGVGLAQVGGGSAAAMTRTAQVTILA